MGAVAILADSKANWPLWSLRHGLVDSISAARDGMPMWYVIRSVNGHEMVPCLLEEASLSQMLGFASRTSARTRLAALRRVPGLLLEIDRGYSAAPRQRPKARWATDPFRADYWFRVIDQYRLPKVAEHDGHGSTWLEDAREQLRSHARASNSLRECLVDELGHPCSAGEQYAGGDGEVSRPFELRRRRKRKSRRSRR